MPAALVPASLRVGGEVFKSGRAAAPIPPMTMPLAAGVSWLRNGNGSSSWQFICSPSLRSHGLPTASEHGLPTASEGPRPLSVFELWTSHPSASPLDMTWPES
jgi:hypothetical protein